ncbi:restriction endonuclease subunit S [Limosilactobacillus vaginalis]|uniref:restriction endonuclease subunit S n=1 Tax=Limosilactobacillus vaginalis TaxID=1633 RepID=UPI0025A33084|nr:restriction endonuclease subunit S [Limosilactobacillus vaginalis]MDM8304299.1 restriction endonuclease subunit S [Limosilactobacillus vaginalis]
MKVVLNDYVEIVNERVDISEADSNSYVSTDNLLPNRGGVDFPAKNLPKTRYVQTYKRKDILISNIRPYFKKIWLASESGTKSNDVLCFRTKNRMLLQEYLYVVLQSDNFFDYVTRTSKGTKMPRGDKDAIKQYQFDLPDLEEQFKIANSILILENKIKLNKAINDNLLELLNAQYKYLLSKHNLAKVKLSELCDISAGGDKPKKISKMKSNENLVPVYSNGTNKDGLYGYTNKAKIFKKAVTISARGTIGYTVLRTEPFVPIVRLISLQSKGAISAEFLYLLISNLSIQGYGSTQQQITVPYMKKIVVNIPSLDLINKFQKEISPLFNQIDRNKRENEQLTNIRNVLLDKFF